MAAGCGPPRMLHDATSLPLPRRRTRGDRKTDTELMVSAKCIIDAGPGAAIAIGF
jgi:hypothetical protein